MRIAIVDDEQDELDCLSRRLEHQLSLLGYTENVIRCYRSAEEFLAAWHPGGCDLILLDIYMEGMPGIEAARRIRERDADCRLVFCTSSNAFASEKLRGGGPLLSAQALLGQRHHEHAPEAGSGKLRVHPLHHPA